MVPYRDLAGYVFRSLRELLKRLALLQRQDEQAQVSADLPVSLGKLHTVCVQGTRVLSIQWWAATLLPRTTFDSGTNHL